MWHVVTRVLLTGQKRLCVNGASTLRRGSSPWVIDCDYKAAATTIPLADSTCNRHSPSVGCTKTVLWRIFKESD